MAPADAGAGSAKTHRRQTRGLKKKTRLQADPRGAFLHSHPRVSGVRGCGNRYNKNAQSINLNS